MISQPDRSRLLCLIVALCTSQVVWAVGPDDSGVALDRWKQLKLKGDEEAHRGHPAKAEQQYKRALAEANKHGGSSRAVQESLRSLADLYLKQGNYVQAQDYYERCLEVTERLAGAGAGSVEPLLRKLAMLYIRERQMPKAESCLRRALAILEKEPGNIPERVAVLRDLVVVCDAERNTKLADRYVKRVLDLKMPRTPIEKINSDTAGGDKPYRFIASSADFYLKESRPIEAEQMLEIELSVLNARGAHPTQRLAYVLYHLGNYAMLAGDLTRAEELGAQCLSVRHKLNTVDPDYIGTLELMAAIKAKQNRPDEAVAFYRQELEVANKLPPKDSPAASDIYYYIGHSLMDDHKYPEAVKAYVQSLQSQRKTAGSGDPLSATVVAEIGSTLAKVENRRESVSVIERALPALEAAGPAGKKNAAQLRKILGRLPPTAPASRRR